MTIFDPGRYKLFHIIRNELLLILHLLEIKIVERKQF